jgi:hypothetical protein
MRAKSLRIHAGPGSGTLNFSIIYIYLLIMQVKVKVSESGLSIKEKVRLITELTEDISAAVISYHR